MHFKGGEVPSGKALENESDLDGWRWGEGVGEERERGDPRKENCEQDKGREAGHVCSGGW